jgi:gliding motility-associated-like protein
MLRVLSIIGLITLSAGSFAQISSTFNSNAEGWSTPDDADGTIGHSATGGNPGGYVFGTPFIINFGMTQLFVPFYFIAPTAYLGNRSAYYSGTLRYDVQLSSSAGNVNQYAEVILRSSNVMIYYFPSTTFQPPAAPTWTTFSVPLHNASGFWKTTNDPAGPAASEANLQFILNNLTSLEIRGLYRDANIAGRLDNVWFTPPIIITTQPSSTSVCLGATASLTTAATNNPSITYQWQFLSSVNVWTNVANGGGFSGATTATLSVNTTGNVGAGTYRCRVSGANANDVFTNTATITINPLPSPPSTTGASRCGPGSVTLSASGGSAAQYRWYTVPSGGTPIGGQTNSTYNTPSLSTTTTYYAAINNGTCESTRTAAIATILSPPAAPSTVGAESCIPSSVVLKASGGLDGQYRWYTIPVGGVPLPGQTSGTLVTDVLAITTTFYVAINNGTCEGARSPAQARIAEIGCGNSPPVIEAAVSAIYVEGTVIIDLTPLVSDPDDNLDISTLRLLSSTSQQGASASINASNQLVLTYGGILFAGIDFISIEVCDLAGACTQQQLEIQVGGDIVVFNGFSPNGDDFNPFFLIQYIDLFPDTRENKVTIFNRWGDTVFEIDNYDNVNRVFTGLNNNGNELPAGTYYYKIEFRSGRKALTGFISLKR